MPCYHADLSDQKKMGDIKEAKRKSRLESKEQAADGA